MVVIVSSSLPFNDNCNMNDRSRRDWIAAIESIIATSTLNSLLNPKLNLIDPKPQPSNHVPS